MLCKSCPSLSGHLFLLSALPKNPLSLHEYAVLPEFEERASQLAPWHYLSSLNAIAGLDGKICTLVLRQWLSMGPSSVPRLPATKEPCFLRIAQLDLLCGKERSVELDSSVELDRNCLMSA